MILASATLKRFPPPSRTQALVRELQRLGCMVRVERPAYRLELELPEDEFFWRRSGELVSLLAAYSDVVSWSGRIYEFCDPPRAELPAPLKG